ncbi:MAG: Tfp pilus assembly protein FimT/FimU [Gemmatimonadota bacterium]
MSAERRGFTIVELVIALLIGSILTSIALSSFGNVQGRLAVRGARNTFVSLQARARAQAIETGDPVGVLVDVVGDSVTLVSQAGQTLENIHFDNEFNVDLKATGNIIVCMNSRGYADTDCNNFASPVRLEFWQGADSASVVILPLGQLVY